jgi:hypothetical protein
VWFSADHWTGHILIAVILFRALCSLRAWVLDAIAYQVTLHSGILMLTHHELGAEYIPESEVQIASRNKR